MESDTVVVRGFSNTFAYDKKVEVMNLQFIEGDDLERKWKAARRQRLKQQEEKLWSEFVKDEDVLRNAVKDDPYQFLDRLPEAQVKELVETELSRIKKVLEGPKRGAGDSPRADPAEIDHSVTFEEVERDEVFHIFDDGKDGSGEDNLNDTLESPCTVRERDSESEGNAPAPDRAAAAAAVARATGMSILSTSATSQEKSTSETVATVIESSIYCAKVKDLRLKIIQELKDIIVSLENQNIASLDSSQLRQFCRRAAEYSGRYQRIHLYQLQRQVNDIKRHNALALPFAKHTQFQSQMVRIVALHQSTLQSLQVFHKSFEQTACLRECSTQLAQICATLKDSTAACKEVAVPSDFSAARQLYNDKLLAICEELEQTVRHYTSRVDEYIAAAEQAFTSKSNRRYSKSKAKKKNWSQKGTKNSSMTETNTRLSMYSLDTLRLNQNGNKGNNKSESGRIDSSRKKGKVVKNSPKSHRKTGRRPLMRDPHLGQDKRRPAQRPDQEIQTMVEAVEAPSSHASPSRVRKSAYPRSPRPSTLVPRIALRPLNPVITKRGKPGAALNETVNSTVRHTNRGFPSPVSVLTHFSPRCYRTNADTEVQTMISDCKLGNNSDRFNTTRSDDCRYSVIASPGKESLRSDPESVRSESGRFSQGSRGKKPGSARDLNTVSGLLYMRERLSDVW